MQRAHHALARAAAAPLSLANRLSPAYIADNAQGQLVYGLDLPRTDPSEPRYIDKLVTSDNEWVPKEHKLPFIVVNDHYPPKIDSPPPAFPSFKSFLTRPDLWLRLVC